MEPDPKVKDLCLAEGLDAAQAQIPLDIHSKNLDAAEGEVLEIGFNPRVFLVGRELKEICLHGEETKLKTHPNKKNKRSKPS